MPPASPSQTPPEESFILEVGRALADRTFAKLTLSEPGGAEPDLRNIYGKWIETKAGPRLSLVFRYARRDETKNLPAEEALAFLRREVGASWLRARLFTTAGDWEYHRRTDGAAQVKRSRATFTVAPDPKHDRQKARALPQQGRGFLEELGVTNAGGEPRPGMADKLRQIERFVELFAHVLDGSPLQGRDTVHVVDLGAGKGYLTFAVAEYLRARGIGGTVTGVEVRPELVRKTNAVARSCGIPRLEFIEGSIESWSPERKADVFIALHACNTATDDALYRALEAEAAIILAAPCCHQELRPQMVAPEVLQPVLRHGILEERMAEAVTDAIRSLLLEIRGYKASVFEFISPEHTGKNLMISATKREHSIDPQPLRERLRALLEFYGIREQRLANLLHEPL